MQLPKNTPVISLLQTIRNLPRFVKNPITVLEEYFNTQGDTFIMPLGIRKTAMLTANPQLIQYILQKNHRNFQKSELQVEQLAHFIGNGLLTSNGDYWLQQRRLIQPGFHRKKLAGLVQIMLLEIDSYLNQLEKRQQQEATFRMHQEMTELTFSIVAKALFSTDVEKSALHQLSDNFNRIQAFMSRQYRQLYLKRWFKLSGTFSKYERIAEDLRQIVLDIIRRRKESQEQHEDLLDMLLQTRYEDSGAGMTDQQLLDESLILILAGHETSANALAWGWYLLGQHPEIVETIRSEIEVNIGKGAPTFENLQKFEYLEQVVQEIMRLYPPAWILERIPIKDDEFEGIRLPKNRIIGMDIYRVHRDPQYWPEPEKFDPSRFTKEAIKKRPAFAYLPFGGGPRLCIGSNFAMMEMKLTLIRMLQRFDLELVNDQTVEVMPMITLRPEGDIFIKLT